MPLSVLPSGFRPAKADTQGLSVYPEKVITPEVLAGAGRKPGEYFIVRLPVAALHSLHLSVIVDNQPLGPAGHALIPELNVFAYEQDKTRWKPVLLELARLASQGIVHWPAK